ncbi:MAG: hypothetical protein RR922_02105 [Clostridia bacterium]
MKYSCETCKYASPEKDREYIYCSLYKKVFERDDFCKSHEDK